MRTVEHPRAVGTGGFVGKLLFGGLFHDPVETQQRANCPLLADRIANLDGARQRLFSGDGFEAFKPFFEGAVEWIGILCLCYTDTR